MEQLRFVGVILLFSLPMVLIEYLICRFAKNIVMKFILPIALFVLGVVLIFLSKFVPAQGFQSLAYVIYGMISVGIGAITGAFGLLYSRFRNNKVV